MKDLKILFAALVCYRHNIHILHWKCIGHKFDMLHSLFDEYNDKIGDFIDDIGEMLLVNGENPLGLDECLKILTDDDTHFLILNSNEDYDCEKALNALNMMFNTLLELYDELTDDDDISSDCISKLDEHKYWIRIENNYKNKRRMMK